LIPDAHAIEPHHDRRMTTAPTSVADPRRLTRSRDGRILAGVCAGAGTYFDIDPVIFRVVFAVLSVFGGAGLVIYAMAWLLIPETGSPHTRVERWLDGRHPDRRRDLLIVGVVVFVLLFALRRNNFALRISGAVFLTIVVIAVAALLGNWRNEHRPRTDLRPDQPTTPHDPTPQWQPSASSYQSTGPYQSTSRYQSTASSSTTAWSHTPIQRRPHSWLGWLILGTTFFVAGVFSIVGLTGLAHPQPADVLAALVAVVGVGLIVGAVRGRAWLMIPVGLLLVALLGVADAVPRNLTWTSGTRTWTPISANINSPYVLGAGDATLDLSNLGAAQTATIVSRIGAGRLIVLVPRGSSVSVHARTSAGRVLLFGHRQAGTGVDDRFSVISPRPAAGTLTLDLQVGFGDVEVRDASS
jgi:phage shock protein PspC (stress-responsive transcriptional regulator)